MNADSPDAIVLCAEADSTVGFGHLGEIRAIADALQVKGASSALFAVGPQRFIHESLTWVPDHAALACVLDHFANRKSVWSFRRPLSQELEGTFARLRPAKTWIAD